MAEDGWPGQGDMTAEQLGKISERQTSCPSSDWLMSRGQGDGKRLKCVSKKRRGNSETHLVKCCKKQKT